MNRAAIGSSLLESRAEIAIISQKIAFLEILNKEYRLAA
jgi:hypothetical protein